MRRFLVAVFILGISLSAAAGDPISAHAQTHAGYLAASGAWHHSDLTPLSADYGGPCDWAGEAIYRGNHPEERWDAYAASPGHAAVVNAPWTHHGAGVAEANGVSIVVDVFCVATPEPTTTTTTTAPQPVAQVPVVMSAKTPVGEPPPICDPDASSVGLCIR